MIRTVFNPLSKFLLLTKTCPPSGSRQTAEVDELNRRCMIFEVVPVKYHGSPLRSLPFYALCSLPFKQSPFVSYQRIDKNTAENFIHK